LGFRLPYTTPTVRIVKKGTKRDILKRKKKGENVGCSYGRRLGHGNAS
jgi:hypothetical protein